MMEQPADWWKMERVTSHPGEVLREDFLKPMGVSANYLAVRTRMPATRVGEILHERRAVSPDMALRLARFFGTSAKFWMNLQAMHELRKARLGPGRGIEREIEPLGVSRT